MRFVLFRTTAALAAALACLAGSVGRTAACAYHSGGKAFAAHPGAIDVAMAIQAAADAGTIEPQSARVGPGPAWQPAQPTPTLARSQNIAPREEVAHHHR